MALWFKSAACLTLRLWGFLDHWLESLAVTRVNGWATRSSKMAGQHPIDSPECALRILHEQKTSGKMPGRWIRRMRIVPSPRQARASRHQPQKQTHILCWSSWETSMCQAKAVLLLTSSNFCLGSSLNTKGLMASKRKSDQSLLPNTVLPFIACGHKIPTPLATSNLNWSRFADVQLGKSCWPS